MSRLTLFGFCYEYLWCPAHYSDVPEFVSGKCTVFVCYYLQC